MNGDIFCASIICRSYAGHTPPRALPSAVIKVRFECVVILNTRPNSKYTLQKNPSPFRSRIIAHQLPTVGRTMRKRKQYITEPTMFLSLTNWRANVRCLPSDRILQRRATAGRVDANDGLHVRQHRRQSGLFNN